MESKVLAVIPARYDSTRFPGKIVVPLAGKPLVVHVYERVLKATLVDEVVIATDDERVIEAVKPYGAECQMTRKTHTTGTDRVAEVCRARDAAVVINVQGDEPLIDPRTIDDTLRPLLNDPNLDMSTARHPITVEEAQDPNRVKVVCDEAGHALYFSRAPIPFVRDADRRGIPHDCYWQHVGIYGYRREFLLNYSQMSPSALEQLELLEQLRVLERGHKIIVVDTEYRGIGVDAPADLKEVEEILAQSGQG